MLAETLTKNWGWFEILTAGRTDVHKNIVYVMKNVYTTISNKGRNDKAT